MDSNKLDKITVTTKNNVTTTLNTSNTISDMIETIVNNSDKQEVTKDYLLTINGKSTTLKYLNISEIKDNDSFNSIPHPYFSNIKKEKVDKKNIIDVTTMDDIVVYSPHPDDEILGTCTLLHTCFKLNKNIKVVYLTSGKTAGDPTLRQKEATLGIKELGGNESHLFFTDMPFYSSEERSITDKDYEYIKELFRKYNSKYVFICADMFNPHRTHKKCFDCLFKVLNEDKEFENIQVFFYYSTWYWPEEDEYNYIMPYNFEIYKCKIKAMLEHSSQMLTNFMGNDPRPFYQRASFRDSKLGIKNGHDFCEIFYKWR